MPQPLRRFTSSPSRFTALIAIPLAACGAGASGGPTRPLDLLTRDEDEVAIVCRDDGTVAVPAAFVVSLNSDDDERQRPDDRDRKRGRLHAAENNLRVLRFRGETRAVKVRVNAPEDVAGGGAQEGRRVRSWREPFTGGRFDFTVDHPLPATLQIEGTNRSGREDDTAYTFVFSDGADQGVCEGRLAGTIVSVAASLRVGDGGMPNRDRKLLILGAGRTEVTLAPAITLEPEWSYPGDSRFADARALATDFTADSLFTPTLDRDTLRLVLKSAHGQRIVAHRPLNLTGPRSVRVRRGRSFTAETGWLDANTGTFSLFTAGITYTMLDQFGEPIRDSAYGGATPQIRENIGIALRSDIATVTAWIAGTLRWTRDWRDKPEGEFTDSLKVRDITRDVIRRAVLLPDGTPAGRFEFDPVLQNGGRMMTATPNHVWFLTVNGRESPAVRVSATANTFEVTAFDTRLQGGGTQIRLRSVYTVRIP